MEWMTELPRKEGWYWTWNHYGGKNGNFQVVYIGFAEYDNVLSVYGINPLWEVITLVRYVEKYPDAHWLGALPLPECPTKDDIVVELRRPQSARNP